MGGRSDGLSTRWSGALAAKYARVLHSPDLVVDVLSASESRASVEERLGEYFSIGVRLVWVADPERRTVRACRSLQDVRTLSEEDTLSGDDVLPGFCVPVCRLFED